MALHTARSSKTMDALFSAHFLHMRLSVALVWESILDGERSGTILAARKSRRCPHDQSGTFDEKYGEVLALDDLSFEIEEGQVYGFLGPNGAGKSTTMNIMTGCLSATAGSVTIGGHDVFEEPDAAKRRIGDLSQGYRQRVGIAQALLGEPRVIILDEPTVGLDPIQIIEIRDLIRSLGQSHTVILSSHILSEVQAICDKILIIAHGRLVAFDTPAKLEERLAATGEFSLTTDVSLDAARKALAGVKTLAEVLPLVSVKIAPKSTTNTARNEHMQMRMNFLRRR